MKLQAIERLRALATSSYGESLEFVKLIAQQALGPVVIDPANSISIQAGEPHIQITPLNEITIDQLEYFANTVQMARHLNPRVVSVSPDRDHANGAIKVVFARN